MQFWLRTLGTFAGITSLGMLMDRLMLREGVPRFDLLLISNALVGGVAAALVVVWTIRQKQHAALVSSRMRVIAEMNHHIRNALQVIQYSSWGRQSDAEMQAIQQSVQRITWAVREVLPQMLSEEGEFAGAEKTEYRKPPSPQGASVEPGATKVRER